ncbi:MAG: hypothetical protein J6F33_00490, partial [Acidaminococcaceae bacterium]|nr:hypothetical protein [Acidaminococcaceae bacterium]
MNKIYKVIWSKVRNCYVVVSELAKRNGKCSSSLNKKIIASFLAAGLVAALPTGVEAETFNPGTGSGIGVLSRNNNAWGNRTVVLNYQFFRKGEPVYIIWDNGGDQKFRAIDSNGSAFSSGSTIDQLVNRLRSSEYSTVTWIDLGTKNSTAFGDRTTVSGEGATAFGFYTSATANQATAFGHRTTATANRATAFGIETTASGKNSTSFGYKTQAVGENSTAWGSNTQAVGGGATAFGARTQARAENSVAWGNNSIVSGGRAIVNGVEYTDLEALRYNGDDGDSYYAYYLTGRDSAGNVVRLGGKEDDPDIIEGGYKYTYIKNSSGWVDYDANASAINVWYGEDEAARQKIDAWIAKTGADGGNGAVAGQYSTAFGNSSEVYAKNALGALGGKVEAGAHNSAAIGVTAEVSSKNAYAIGNGVTIGTGSAGSVALGGNGILKYDGTEYDDIIIRKRTYYDNTTHQEIEEYNVIGINSDGSEVQLNTTPFTTKDAALADIREKNPDYTSVGTGATNAFAAVGGKVSDNATNAIAMGSKASATLADSVALGSNAVANRAPATNAGHDVLTGKSYAGTGADSPVWKSTLAAVSVGGGEVLVDDGSGNMVTKTATRQITGVAAGSEETDAVNVAQLKRAAALETDNRNVGLIVNADGRREITSPYIHVEGVGDATAAFNNALAAYLISIEYTSLDDADKPAALATKIEELKTNNHFAVAKGTNSLAIGYEAQTDTSANKSGVFGNSSYVSGENSYSIGNSNNIYSNNTVALGNNINTGTGSNYAVAIGDTVFIDSNVSNATVIGYQASASVADSVALGSYSVASRRADGDAGYDFNTGKASTDITNNAWRPTHAAISIGDDSNVTRQITGVAA